MKTINVVNQKGGVGKTTNATNIAKGLVDKGYKVLLIDADPQFNSTSQLLDFKKEVELKELKHEDIYINEDIFLSLLKKAVDIKSFKYELADVLSDDCDIEDAIIKTKYDNLDLIPSSLKLGATPSKLIVASVQGNNINNILYNQISIIENNYDYCIIDSAPSQDIILQNTLLISDLILIPTQCVLSSLSGFINTLKYLIKIKKQYQVNYDIYLLFTMINRNKNDREIIELFNKYYSNGTLKTSIRYRSAVVSNSDDKNKLLVDSNTNLSEDYKNLINELLEKMIAGSEEQL